MIVYHPKKWRGFSVLCGRHCLRGSVFVLSLPYGIVAGLIALFVKLDQTHNWGVFDGQFGHTVREDSFFDHPYSLQIWATSLGFLLVFRGNLAYARYWEGRMQLARMCSYYQDAATNAVCFDEANKNVNQYREWKQMILHQFSLLHALSIQCLRLDESLDNLVVFNRLEGYSTAGSGRYAITQDALLSAVNEGLNREIGPSMPEDRGALILKQLAEAEAEALAATNADSVATIDIESGLHDVKGSVNPSERHRLDGAVSDNAQTPRVTRQASEDMEKDLGGGHRGSGHTAEEIGIYSRAAAEHPLGVIEGLWGNERQALKGCETFNGARVQLAQSWIVRAIVRRRKAGGLAVDAPVVATGIYRAFMTGTDAFQQCKKIVDTPFPYPYAQAVLFMLSMYSIFAPFLICEIVNDTGFAVLISIIAVWSFAVMNEVARQLEDPFGHEVNQLPLEDLHIDLNERLWALTQRAFKKDDWSLQNGTLEFRRSATDIHATSSDTEAEGTPVEEWPAETVAAWVRTVLPAQGTDGNGVAHMDQFASRIVEEDISGCELRSLGESHLREMGLRKIGHCLKLLGAIRELK